MILSLLSSKGSPNTSWFCSHISTHWFISSMSAPVNRFFSTTQIHTFGGSHWSQTYLFHTKVRENYFLMLKLIKTSVSKKQSWTLLGLFTVWWVKGAWNFTLSQLGPNIALSLPRMGCIWMSHRLSNSCLHYSFTTL